MNKSDMNKLDKKAKTLMLVSSIIGMVIFTIVLGVAAWLIEVKVVSVIIAVVMVVSWISTFVSPLVRYERYRYAFTEDEIRVREGFLWVSTQVIPIERLHQVEMQSGPLDQMFGFAKVTVTTAGGQATIRFIKEDVAEKIVEDLKNKINSFSIATRGKNQNAFANDEQE